MLLWNSRNIVMKEISFQEVGKVVAIFVVGFIAIVVGWYILIKGH